MSKSKKIVSILLSIVLVVMFVVSVVDTNEVRYETNFSQENMITHIEKLSENGPRSLVDKEENELAMKYIISQIESYGIVNQDTTEVPAYQVQSYVATHDSGKYQNFYLENVIVHIPANAESTTDEAIMFMGHFDSVPMGEGSSDDALACSTMLEAIRYYLDKMKNGYTISNDLVFCFVNGEEYNLYGSRAFMNEFVAFDNIVERIKFATNLESRGTSGTLIMFETAKNNYNTVQFFSEVNKSLFTCSIATLVYDMMPNGTDFTNFKDVYQGLNMANVGGGENYHTQNDILENIEMSYLSQQAQIVDSLIEKLSNYDLKQLHDAEESAIFFSYLNLKTVVYNHTMVIVLAVILILLVVANIVFSVRSKQNHLKNTSKAMFTVVVGLVLTSGITYLCYFVFQWIAVLFGTIDKHMVGTITYSNTAIVVGIGILALAITALTTKAACKWLKIERRDMTRAFAYLHAFLGIVVSFVLADASYLFVFSGMMLMINELGVTLCKKKDFEKYHGELLASALYFPIVIPIIVLAITALGMTMAYVYGLVFALAVFGIGININIEVKNKWCSVAVMTIPLVIFFIVSLGNPNANVNLQGKQNISRLPYDDALVYVANEDGTSEYRIYDLNAVKAVSKYAPKMEYNGEYYAGQGEKQDITLSVLATATGNVLTVKKNASESLVYLDFKNIKAKSFTIDDGITVQEYEFGEVETYAIKIHSDCVVTLNDGTADVEYREVFRDYESMIPEAYAQDEERLHFNLWLADEFTLVFI